ncbi:unnamed protein product, partial [Polarella glacialis]
MGSSVTDTVSSGFFDDNYFKNSPGVLQLGVLASLLGAGLRLALCPTPVSTTHSTISSLGGISLVASPQSLNTEEPGQADSLGFKGIIAGLFMAWGIGADYVTNSFATSVGSKALILRQTFAIATVYEFVGCISMSVQEFGWLFAHPSERLFPRLPTSSALWRVSGSAFVNPDARGKGGAEQDHAQRLYPDFKGSQWQQALNWLSLMPVARVVPNEITYNAAVSDRICPCVGSGETCPRFHFATLCSR